MTHEGSGSHGCCVSMLLGRFASTGFWNTGLCLPRFPQPPKLYLGRGSKPSVFPTDCHSHHSWIHVVVRTEKIPSPTRIISLACAVGHVRYFDAFCNLSRTGSSRFHFGLENLIDGFSCHVFDQYCGSTSLVTASDCPQPWLSRLQRRYVCCPFWRPVYRVGTGRKFSRGQQLHRFSACHEHSSPPL